MEPMGKHPRRPRRSYTPQFKAEIVSLCLQGDRPISQIAHEFDLTQSVVRNWVRQAHHDTSDPGIDTPLTSDEKTELARLRRENQRLREDVQILTRATAFFAKETR